jgi:hypothetical protein
MDLSATRRNTNAAAANRYFNGSVKKPSQINCRNSNLYAMGDGVSV